MPLLLLVLVFLVLPVLELAVIIQVAQGIGVLETVGLLVLVSVLGGWLCRREGVGVLRRIRQSLRAGQLPHRDVVDGGLILLAGALLCTPGFISDVLGVVLLLPPTRAPIRAVVLRSLARRASFVVVGGPGPAGQGPARRVIDTTEAGRL